jgi:hypothetical protein
MRQASAVVVWDKRDSDGGGKGWQGNTRLRSMDCLRGYLYPGFRV